VAAAPAARAASAGPSGASERSKGGFGTLAGLVKEKAAAKMDSMDLGRDADDSFSVLAESSASLELEAPAEEQSAADGGVGLLEQQLASGLWAGTGTGAEPVRQARATALALLELLRQGITSSHALHGAQVKKAVEALLALVPQLSGAPDVAELALGVAWLVAAGPRTRGKIAEAAQPLAGLSSRLQNEVALRQHVDALATR
jgi:Ca-activated chloride channel family protein